MAAAPGDPDECHIVEREVVENGADGLVPVRCRRQLVLLKSAALPRTFEHHHVVAGVGEVWRDREELLDVAVRTTEQHDRALGIGRGAAAVRRQATAPLPVAVWDQVAILGAEAKRLPHQCDEPLPGGTLVGVARAHEELGRAQVVGGSQCASVRQGAVSEGEKLTLVGGEAGKTRQDRLNFRQCVDPAVAQIADPTV
jgi:hypothetical protein